MKPGLPLARDLRPDDGLVRRRSPRRLPAQPPPAAPDDSGTPGLPPGVQEILKLSKAGLGDERYHREDPKRRRLLRVDQRSIIFLNNQGVHQSVISAMMQTHSAGATIPSAPVAPLAPSIPPPDNRRTGKSGPHLRPGRGPVNGFISRAIVAVRGMDSNTWRTGVASGGRPRMAALPGRRTLGVH